MPSSSPQEYVYFNGSICPVEEAKVGIKTHAFMYGTSVFEGIRGYWLPESKQIAIFRMREHYDRMLRNARIFHMTLDLSLEDLDRITVELFQKNAPSTDTYIRPMVYKSGEFIGPGLDRSPTSFCLWTQPLGEYLALDKGLHVCVSSWRRSDDNVIAPRAKAGGSYMNAALAITDAKRAGFDDAIVLTEDGHVSEGSAMNMFMVRDGKLITPAATDNILEGVTRHTIMTLAKNELGLDTIERTVDRTELYVADEIFFCGTGAQVAPVTQIDHRAIGDGNIGPISKKLQTLYFDVVKNKIPKYSNWCTLVDVSQPALAAR